MHFLHPWFLLGLGAVSVPILLHLVFTLKARVVPFPTVRYLRQVDRQVTRRQKLRELLILALRCLTLALLALGLAAPVLRPSSGGPAGPGGLAAAIVLDDSYSMGMLDAEGPLFARARALTRTILGTLQAGDAVALITSRRPPAMTRDPGGLAADLEKMEPSAGADPLGPRVRAAARLLRQTPAAQRELYVVSDFQRRAVDFSESELRDPAFTPILVPVSSPRRDSLAVTALDPLSPFATPEAPFRLRVAVANRGPQPAGRNLRIRVDGLPAAERMVFVPPRGSVSVTVDLHFDRPGWKTVEAELEGDAVPADNRRLLPVHVRSSLGVLVIREDAGGAMPRSFYLEKALNPGGTAPTGVRIAALAPAALEGSDPAGFAAVFLVECVPSTQDAVATLRTYVAGGGSLVIVAGPDLDPAAFNEALAPGGDLGPLSPAVLAGAAGGDRDPSGYQSIKEVDLRHPIFARLRRGDAPIDIGSAVFYRTARVEPAEREGASVLARFGNGDPAVVERPFGLGRTVLVASALHPDVTNFPYKVSFVPFLHSLVAYLAQPAGTAGIRVGDPLRLQIPRERAPRTARGIPPGAEPREAEARTVGSLAVFDFGPADSPGTATLEWASSERLETRRVAVNVDPEEGILEFEDPARIAPSAFVVRDARELTALLGRIRRGTSLAGALLALALLAAIAESILSNRFAFGGGRPVEPPSAPLAAPPPGAEAYH